MEEEFRAILLAASGVTALVPVARISLGHHPQGSGSPYIVASKASGADAMTLQGPDGLWLSRMQVDCYAPTLAGASAIERAVIGVLHGYRDGKFRLIEHADSRDMGREGGTNEAERLHRVSLDFMTHWRQT